MTSSDVPTVCPTVIDDQSEMKVSFTVSSQSILKRLSQNFATFII